ncbi:MAG: YciI family protein [Anaerolineae bacterium]
MTMQYLLMIYGDETTEAQMSEAERQTRDEQYFAFSREARERGVFVSGEALHASSAATTVRVRQGKTLTTDGPFVETREQLGGFYILNCKDLDEAIECAAKIPGAQTCAVEIRPILVFN